MTPTIQCSHSRRTSLRLAFFLSTLIAALIPLHAQQPPQVQSPEVQPDGKVTFRFFDPGAKEVKLNSKARPNPLS